MSQFMIDRSVRPTSQPFRVSNLPPFESRKLDNGIPVYLMQFGQSDVVDVQAIIGSGKSHQNKTGQASWMMKSLLEGTTSWSSLQIAQQLDGLGAWLNPSTSEDSMTLKLATTTTNFSKVLPIFKEVLLSPTFPRKEFQDMQKRAIDRQRVSEQKTSTQASRHFGKLLFGDGHPYGSYMGTDELKALSLEDLRTFHRNHVYPGNIKLAVVGKFDSKAIMKMLNTQFGGLSIQAYPKLEEVGHLDEFAANLGRHSFKLGNLQSSIQVGHLGMKRTHDDYYPMQVVNTVLGGYYGSRLMKSIREEKGYTYGIYSGWMGLKQGGALLVSTDVANEYVGDTLNLIKIELDRLRNDLMDESELGLVKNYLLGQSINKRETPFQLGDLLMFSLVHDISFGEMDRKYEVIQNMTPQLVLDMAQKHLKPDQLLEVIVGNWESA
ncbi:pitrilysin family protein [Pontibacter sp. G13]|uniref:M16 family metallopeptidase n=1 Tax=Pontibacter sp. G13 TaxID=3074898 RepID=UPI00288B5A20|nr:pitrilysin family protein [Pontibacter sp. G13]WNJ16344.1 pitrilysin family protein [Pontibacter sp. G13]